MFAHMLPGVIGIVAGAFIGLIGVYSNTQKHRTVKVVLVVLLLLVAAASLHQESQAAKEAVEEREKTVYAESHSAQSLRELEEASREFKRTEEAHRAAKVELAEKLEKNQALVQNLFGRIVELSDNLESVQEAAKKEQRQKIAAIGEAARETLMSVARKEALLPESEISKMESGLNKQEPIPAATLKLLQANLEAKHRIDRKQDEDSVE